MNPADLQFFYTGSHDYPILAAVDTVGFYFNSRGESYSATPRLAHGLNYLKESGRLRDYTMITLSEVLNYIRQDSKTRFLKKLNLVNPDVKITEEITQQVIYKLQQNRAFNEDSAMEMDNLDICFVLSSKGLIKECNNRFFVEKDLKNIKDFRDIPLTQAILNV